MRVSCKCSSGSSSGSSAAAMPPWAHTVEPELSCALVTTSTRSTLVRNSRAAVSPAIPEPTTMTSAVMVHPGGGAARPRTNELMRTIYRALGALKLRPLFEGVPALFVKLVHRYARTFEAVAVGHAAGVVALLHDPVVTVDKDHAGLERAGLVIRERAVGNDDDDVARLYQMRGGTVDADLAAAGFAGDRVGGEPRPVGDVDNVHLLARQNI